MYNNRWLINIAKHSYYRGSAKLPAKFLSEVDNAASWMGWYYDDNHWQDTHLYTPKQMKEIAMRALKRDEERHKKWLEERERENHE